MCEAVDGGGVDAEVGRGQERSESVKFTDVPVCEFDSDDVGVLGKLEDVVCVEVETTDDGGEVIYKEGCGRG